MDGTIVKAHQHASGAKKKATPAYENEAIGRSRGGLTSKFHCVVDGLGNPVDFILTGGEVHDSVCANDLL